MRTNKTKIEFNSKQELDDLIELFTSKNPVLPSEVLKMYKSVEGFLVRVHQLGYTSGYEKGVGMKKQIEKNL